MDNSVCVTVKAKLRTEFGNAQSYRSLKRENPAAAAEWRAMIKDVVTHLKTSEEAYKDDGVTDNKVISLLGSLNYAADAVNKFNAVTGKKAEMQTTLKQGKTVLMTATSKLTA